MVSPLPARVCVGPDCWYEVEQTKLAGEFGHVDYQAEKIRIEVDQPEPCKHLILLHEMIHVADQICREAGHYTEMLTEKQVEGLAGGLWPMLAASGLWPGASESDIDSIEAYAPAQHTSP